MDFEKHLLLLSKSVQIKNSMAAVREAKMWKKLVSAVALVLLAKKITQTEVMFSVFS